MEFAERITCIVKVRNEGNGAPAKGDGRVGGNEVDEGRIFIKEGEPDLEQRLPLTTKGGESSSGHAGE